MHKMISLILGVLAVGVVFHVYPGSSQDALVTKHGGADSRLLRQFQKRSEQPRAEQKKDAASLLATKQGGAKTRLLYQYRRQVGKGSVRPKA